jgi:hypothetical protein
LLAGPARRIFRDYPVEIFENLKWVDSFKPKLCEATIKARLVHGFLPNPVFAPFVSKKLLNSRLSVAEKRLHLFAKRVAIPNRGAILPDKRVLILP